MTFQNPTVNDLLDSNSDDLESTIDLLDSISDQPESNCDTAELATDQKTFDEVLTNGLEQWFSIFRML